jgi:hypothetical protein
MSGMRALGAALVSGIALVVLGAAPAHAWHGTGRISALGIDPLTPTTLYAAICDRGLFTSADGGATWTTSGLTDVYVWALAIDPQRPTTLYAGATPHGCGGALVGSRPAGAFKSIDGGRSWTFAGLFGHQVTALAIDPQTPTTVYAGAYSGGVFKSTDGGATWSPTGAGPFQVNALAVDPLAPDTLYAADDVYYDEEGFAWGGGVSKSTDGGATWTVTGLNSGGFSALAIDPQTPGTVYAGSP